MISKLGCSSVKIGQRRPPRIIIVHRIGWNVLFSLKPTRRDVANHFIDRYSPDNVQLGDKLPSVSGCFYGKRHRVTDEMWPRGGCKLIFSSSSIVVAVRLSKTETNVQDNTIRNTFQSRSK